MPPKNALTAHALQLRLSDSPAIQAAGVLNATGQLPADEMALTLRSAGYLGRETAAVLADLYQQTPAEKARSMRAAGYHATIVANELRAMGMAGQAIVNLLREVGYSANDTGVAIRTALNVVEINEVVAILHRAGYSADEIAVYASKIANTPIHVVAEIFNRLGVPAKEVVNSLRLAYDYATTVAVAEAMRYARYGVEEVGRALKDVYNLSAEALTDIFHKARYTAEEAVRVLKNVYNQSAEWVAGRLKDIYRLGGDVVETVLQSVGYAADQIARAMESAFDWIKDKLNPTKW